MIKHLSFVAFLISALFSYPSIAQDKESEKPKDEQAQRSQQYKKIAEKFSKEIRDDWEAINKAVEEENLSFADEWEEAKSDLVESYIELQELIAEAVQADEKAESDQAWQKVDKLGEKMRIKTDYYLNLTASESKKFAEQRGTTQEKAREEIQKYFQKKMDQLKKKVNEFSTSADKAADNTVMALDEQMRSLERRWDKFKEASGKAWSEARKDLSQGFSDFRDQIANAGEEVAKFFRDLF